MGGEVGQYNVKVQLPQDWEAAQKDFKKAKEDTRDNVSDIVNISWHHRGETEEYTFDYLPNTLDIPSDIHEIQEHFKDKKRFRVLVRRVFAESLKIMGYEGNELGAQKSRLKELLKGNLSVRESQDFLSSLENAEHNIDFTRANKIAWGCIRKDILSEGIEIKNDDLLWYIEGMRNKISNIQEAEEKKKQEEEKAAVEAERKKEEQKKKTEKN